MLPWKPMAMASPFFLASFVRATHSFASVMISFTQPWSYRFLSAG